jgi:hypothetical protein
MRKTVLASILGQPQFDGNRRILGLVTFHEIIILHRLAHDFARLERTDYCLSPRRRGTYRRVTFIFDMLAFKRNFAAELQHL